MNHYSEESNRGAHRISTTRHLNLNQLLKEHFVVGGEFNEERGRLLALFLFEKPYALSYEYRKASSSFKKDKVVLTMLEREGLIQQLEKTRKIITFLYIGPLPEEK